MKILIVSDTHKKNENYFKVLEMHHPDMVIHCGDAEGSEYALSAAAKCPVYIVLGNNDFFSDLPREITLDIGPYKVWVTHGHNYYVSMGNETIKKEAIDRGVDIVLFTGGVGENQSLCREEVCKGLEFMGIEIDKSVNDKIHGDEAVISTPASKVKVVVIPTDEELLIASDTMDILKK